MRIGNPKDFLAGLLFVVFGGGVAVASLNYRLGTPSDMGPGYFPLLVSALLVVVGATAVVSSLVKESNAEQNIFSFDLRSVIVITFSVCLFGLSLEYLGLIVAAAATAFVGSMAGQEFELKPAALTALVMAISIPIVFAYLLGVQFPVFPPISDTLGRQWIYLPT